MATVAGGGDGNICRNATENAILISSSPHLGSLLYGMPANSADTVEQDLEPDVLDGLLMLGSVRNDHEKRPIPGRPPIRKPTPSFRKAPHTESVHHREEIIAEVAAGRKASRPGSAPGRRGSVTAQPSASSSGSTPPVADDTTPSARPAPAPSSAEDMADAEPPLTATVAPAVDRDGEDEVDDASTSSSSFSAALEATTTEKTEEVLAPSPAARWRALGEVFVEAPQSVDAAAEETLKIARMCELVTDSTRLLMRRTVLGLVEDVGMDWDGEWQAMRAQHLQANARRMQSVEEERRQAPAVEHHLEAEALDEAEAEAAGAAEPPPEQPDLGKALQDGELEKDVETAMIDKPFVTKIRVMCDELVGLAHSAKMGMRERRRPLGGVVEARQLFGLPNALRPKNEKELAAIAKAEQIAEKLAKREAEEARRRAPDADEHLGAPKPKEEILSFRNERNKVIALRGLDGSGAGAGAGAVAGARSIRRNLIGGQPAPWRKKFAGNPAWKEERELHRSQSVPLWLSGKGRLQWMARHQLEFYELDAPPPVGAFPSPGLTIPAPTAHAPRATAGSSSGGTSGAPSPARRPQSASQATSIGSMRAESATKANMLAAAAGFAVNQPLAVNPVANGCVVNSLVQRRRPSSAASNPMASAASDRLHASSPAPAYSDEALQHTLSKGLSAAENKLKQERLAVHREFVGTSVAGR